MSARLIRGLDSGDTSMPIGDITTVIDIASRDSQDGYFFPLDTHNSWFSNESKLYNTSSLNIQDYVHKGSAEWGGRTTFNVDSLKSGDVVQNVAIEFKLSHWYSEEAITKLEAGDWKVDKLNGESWGYINGLGNAMIEYAEITVGDQTISRITGEFAQIVLSTSASVNSAVGYATDGIGFYERLVATPNSQPINSNRPFPTEGGNYMVILPFFGAGDDTATKEALPLLSCSEGSVQINIKLRPFNEVVQKLFGRRLSPTDTPLNKTVYFKDVLTNVTIQQTTALFPPPFKAFHLITFGNYVSGPNRNTYLRAPVEQLMQFSQTFKFDEPLKYSSNKTNSVADTIDISLPLELNNPTKEIMWIFRRKAVSLNNQWSNFSPVIIDEQPQNNNVQQWLRYGIIQINGVTVDQGDGEWWRSTFAKKHTGGLLTYNNNVYGYCFSLDPDKHQPSGYTNMSKAHSVRLNLTVNVPKSIDPPAVGFGEGTDQGWEIQVYSINYNWVRFENGLAQKAFAD